ncbi:MAG: T9SS type A sorting domain-containing protein [bacterium]
MNRLILLMALGTIALFWQGTAGAQNTIPFDLMGGGGGQSSQGGVHLQDTVGEPAIGVVTSPANVHEIGYWFCVDELHIGPTSAVLITAFDVHASAHGVTLRWAISSADGLRGFNIYRSDKRDGLFVRLNESLLLPAAEFSYHDTHIRPSTTYWYRLGAVDRDGEFYSQTANVETPAAKTALYQNYPNPFNPRTTISFYLAKREIVSLTIYDARGKQVRRLLAEERGFGSHEIVWDGRNDRGEEVGSGVYFYRLIAGKSVQTKKLTFLK